MKKNETYILGLLLLLLSGFILVDLPFISLILAYIAGLIIGKIN